MNQSSDEETALIDWMKQMPLRDIPDAFVFQEGRYLGPFSVAELRLHWANGVFSAMDWIWQPGLENCMALRDFLDATALNHLANANIWVAPEPHFSG
jgi:hypothetical protein